MAHIYVATRSQDTAWTVTLHHPEHTRPVVEATLATTAVAIVMVVSSSTGCTSLHHQGLLPQAPGLTRSICLRLDILKDTILAGTLLRASYMEH